MNEAQEVLAAAFPKLAWFIVVSTLATLSCVLALRFLRGWLGYKARIALVTMTLLALPLCLLPFPPGTWRSAVMERTTTGETVASTFGENAGEAVASESVPPGLGGIDSGVLPARFPAVPRLAAAIVVLSWIAGALVSFARGVGARFFAGRVAFMLDDRVAPEWRESIDRLPAETRRSLRVSYRMGGTGGPFAVGAAGGYVVVLPVPGAFWTPERREFALRHELAHASRGDLGRLALLDLLACLAWHSPFTPRILGEAARAMEEACDGIVVASVRNPASYASLLLELAAGGNGAVPRGGIGILSQSRLERRISMVLLRDNGRPGRGQIVASLIVLASIACFSLAVPGFAVESGSVRTAVGVPDFESSPPQVALPTVSPVEGNDWRVTMSFGPNLNPYDGKDYFHRGLDLSNYRKGDPVLSTVDGEVIHAQYDPGYGNSVFVRSGSVIVGFAHLDRIDVTPGETVVIGKRVGTVGSSGLSTGPHLHYEVITGASGVPASENGTFAGFADGTYVDPAVVLREGGVSFAAR